MGQWKQGQEGGFHAYLLWEQMFILPNAVCRSGSVLSVAAHEGTTLKSKQSKHVFSSTAHIPSFNKQPRVLHDPRILSGDKNLSLVLWGKAKSRPRLQWPLPHASSLSIPSWGQFTAGYGEQPVREVGIKSDSFPRQVLKQTKQKKKSTGLSAPVDGEDPNETLHLPPLTWQQWCCCDGSEPA